ncbi:MAG: TetM/TetW/TetO/TetS family tetracycline resistance ribosomal protection protein, partial [Clostridia bacterium]|nr:TetM/TetW/TetO/TetS family tetracycline resistance ribosomal protection protein [Clostridia bacterium]
MGEIGTKKKLTAGILAHVDAGKTTLSEALLYRAGMLRRPGRVDHRDAFLDTHALERERGITIFSKQARIITDALELTLLDTPGHADLSGETERAIWAMDVAVLVISGTDGVQAHTETLWSLLLRARIPTFIFVTKMDASKLSREELLADLRNCFGEGCLEFPAADEESIAVLDEESLESFMEIGRIGDEEIIRLIRERKLFPVSFGSGLRLEGVDEFLSHLEQYAPVPPRPDIFGARVFKIARDPQAGRMTFLKITGGTLSVRDVLRYAGPNGEVLEEKAAQLRLYSGEKYETVQSVSAGDVVAVTGLTGTRPGQGLGAEPDAGTPQLTPALGYRIGLPQGMDPRTVFPKLRQLEEEEPLLHVVWQPALGEIQAQLMGVLQTEVLASLIKERFGFDVTIGAGQILYRETISSPVEGVGHFEPLRHYAEVHLLLEPGERGSGLTFSSAVSENDLDLNWQRLILTHLMEKEHLGVLTGSPLTDVKITLIAGQAHLKHTEGGDFRQATYRAVRQGLMRAENVLLEPYYRFRLEVPFADVGRAISDIQAMGGEHAAPEEAGGRMVLTGSAPVSAMADYMKEVTAYTRGRGRFSCRVDGYRPCRNAESVISERNYDPEADLDNTPDSVFCAHGAGFVVKWKDVPKYMHLDTGFGKERPSSVSGPAIRRNSRSIDEKELEAN